MSRIIPPKNLRPPFDPDYQLGEMADTASSEKPKLSVEERLDRIERAIWGRNGCPNG